MIALQEVERQLTALGANYRFWGRAEIVELQHILVPGEQIQFCLNGKYAGGYATFVVTDRRLLIVDKKIFYLTVEDMRYDMISEVDFSAQLLSGTIKVCTPTKNLTFTGYRPKILRQTAGYIQQRVLEVRQYTHDPVEAVSPNAAPVPSQPVYLAATDPQLKPANQLLVTPLQPSPAGIQRQHPVNDYEVPYVQELGKEAIMGPDVPSEQPPAPKARLNPYLSPPLLMRRRIGRFGPISHRQ